MADISLLAQAIDRGDMEKAVALTRAAADSGANPQDIIAKGLQAGMASVGEKFSSGEYFLPDMLMAARAMKAGAGEDRHSHHRPGGHRHRGGRHA
jgi:5-methyltetrahydrofolate--homocysteine methyltransferase